jgi:hypothetical protein
MTANAKTIGQRNGPWAMLFRLSLATYPLLLMWCGWVTVNQVKDNEFRETVRQDHDRLARIESKLDQMVPAVTLATQAQYVELLERIIRLESSK